MKRKSRTISKLQDENSTEVINIPTKRLRLNSDNSIEEYKIKNNEINNLVLEKFFNKIKDRVMGFLKNALQEYKNIKFNLQLSANYSIIIDNDISETKEIDHQTEMKLLDSSNEMCEIYTDLCDIIAKESFKFEEDHNGWTLSQIKEIKININKNIYKYTNTHTKVSKFIKLPEAIQLKKACINVENNDIYSFKWSIIAALYPVTKNKQRCSIYKIPDISYNIIRLPNNIVLNFEELNFPLHLSEVKVFESKNPDISVNVFGLKDESTVGAYYTTQREKTTHINLLQLKEEDKWHYVWIRNISRLIKRQLTLHNGKIYICNNCLKHFSNENKFFQHKKECCNKSNFDA